MPKFLTILCLTVVCVTVPLSPCRAQSSEIVIKGPDRYFHFLKDLAIELFKKYHMSVEVHRGNSADTYEWVAFTYADLGLVDRPLSIKESKDFANIVFQTHTVAYEAYALIVSDAIYQSGVHTLTPQQMKCIYESSVENGDGRGTARCALTNDSSDPLVYMNRESRDRSLDLLTEWTYGEEGSPIIDHEEVLRDEEAIRKVNEQDNALSVINYLSMPNMGHTQALSLLSEKGLFTYPSQHTIVHTDYPLKRKLMFVTNDIAVGKIKSVIEFLDTKEGHALLTRHGFVPAE